MGHAVKDAAAKAVANSNRKSTSERTHDDILKTIRKNLAAGLFVMDEDIKYLLGQYDAVVVSLSQRQENGIRQARIILALEATVKNLRETIQAHAANLRENMEAEDAALATSDLSSILEGDVSASTLGVSKEKIQMATIQGSNA